MENDESIKIFLSVWSPFYSPVFLTKDFLKKDDPTVSYHEVYKEVDRFKLIHDKKADIVAAAVSLHWEPESICKTRGIYHFAQINCRDGFFLVGREPYENFHWSELNPKDVLVSGRQPEIALKYAINMNLEYAEKMSPEYAEKMKDVNKKQKFTNMVTIEKTLRAFCQGTGKFVHLQGYWAQQLVYENPKWSIIKVGVNPVSEYSFSSLMASEQFIDGTQYECFLKAYKKALYHAATGDPQKVADKLKCFFFPMAKETPDVLKSCIKQYQELGCWRHDGQITKEHYEKVKEIFLQVKEKEEVSDLRYDEVVRLPA
jgi:hypothetical protein